MLLHNKVLIQFPKFQRSRLHYKKKGSQIFTRPPLGISVYLMGRLDFWFSFWSICILIITKPEIELRLGTNTMCFIYRAIALLVVNDEIVFHKISFTV